MFPLWYYYDYKLKKNAKCIENTEENNRKTTSIIIHILLLLLVILDNLTTYK